MPKAVKEAMSKTAILAACAEETGFTKKECGQVLDALSGTIESCIMKGGVGTFTIPGLIKIKTVKKPARPAKKNVPNPFKPGELMDLKAKPASIAVKCLALKKLKDMA